MFSCSGKKHPQIAGWAFQSFMSFPTKLVEPVRGPESNGIRKKIPPSRENEKTVEEPDPMLTHEGASGENAGIHFD